MRVLVLGMGKTGKLVATVAAEHGHGVHVLDAKENAGASALTPPFVSGFDVVIDFTTPEATIQNMRACLATGAKMVIGTTGWYDKLNDMRGLAERKQAGLSESRLGCCMGRTFLLACRLCFAWRRRWEKI